VCVWGYSHTNGERIRLTSRTRLDKEKGEGFELIRALWFVPTGEDTQSKKNDRHKKHWKSTPDEQELSKRMRSQGRRV